MNTTYTTPRDMQISATSAHFEQIVNDIVCVERIIESLFNFLKSFTKITISMSKNKKITKKI